MKQLKTVDVGHYPEISVKGLYAEFADRPTVKPYMPPKQSKSRQIDKTYFFNIVNSQHEDELTAILRHAKSLRNSVGEQQEKQESIRLTNEMYEAMTKYPWIVSIIFHQA